MKPKKKRIPKEEPKEEPKAEAPKEVGRPSTYTEEIADLICSLLREGKSLRTVCKLEYMPAQSTVYLWLAANKEFSENYARARDYYAQVFEDELIEIADDVSEDVAGELGMPNSVAVQRAKLRIDTRKWLMSKMLPKKYGDRIQAEVEHTGTVTLINSVPRPQR